MFITFEGGEGCGKSTQVKSINSWLTNIGVESIVVRDPGSDAVAEEIRDILLKGSANKMDDITEILLYNAARKQILSNYIYPNRQLGKIILGDRFFDSTWVYQCWCKGVPYETFDALNSIITNLVPEITFLLDVDAEVGLKRSKKINSETANNENRWEDMDLSFHQKIREGYLVRYAQSKGRMIIINVTDNTKKEVKDQIIHHLVEKIEVIKDRLV